MCDLNLSQLSDREHGSGQVRRLLDLDADPLVVADVLSRDEALSGLVAARPGLRSPGAVDGFGVAVRTVIGQQISVASATTRLQRILVPSDLPTVPGTDLFEFPSPGVFAGFDPTGFAMPFARARTLMRLAEAAGDGRLDLSVDADPDEQRARLLELSGIGPWTADYVLMRAMSHPDILLTTDLGVVKSAQAHGVRLDGGRPDLAPWRSYVTNHLWAAHR